MGLINTRKIDCTFEEAFDNILKNASKESMYEWFKWSEWHYRHGNLPISAMVTLMCKDGKGMGIPINLENPSYYCLDGITTVTGKQFVVGIYTLDTTYKKMKSEQGDYFYNYQLFRCGSISGSMSYDKNTIYLVYIKNNKPHNGDFRRMIDAVEKHAASRKYNVAVMDFENERLKEYFIKRGYEPFSILYVDGVIKRYNQQ